MTPPRLAWYRRGRGDLGLLAGGRFHDLGPLLGDLARDPEGALRAGLLAPEALAGYARELSGRGSAEPPPEGFATPLARPGKILCLGRNYREHAAESGSAPPDEPFCFAKLPSVLLAPEAPIRLPEGAGRIEHEGELALVVGRRARRLVPGEAAAAIAGWTIANDLTARERQRADQARGLPWLRSKNFDGACPLGPWVVPRDAVFPGGEPPPDLTPDLELEVRVSGRARQRARTSAMVHGVAAVLAALSRDLTLEPGDLILTGTPAGVGPLAPGDLVEVEIEGIGVLANPVA